MIYTEEQLIKQRESCRKYYEANKEKRKAYHKKNHKKYYIKNREKTLIRTKKYKQENGDKVNKREREYYHKNKETIRRRKRKAAKKRYYNNINYNIRCKLRTRFRKVLKGNSKSSSVLKLLGCNIEEFKKHIELLWTVGMNWENYNLYGWHIDHIKPCKDFDLTKPEEQAECFHYSNLRPLWAEDNLARNRKC